MSRPGMASVVDPLLRAVGVKPQPYRALLRAQLLMDFRSQHFGRATATGPNALITPLFWVIGQYMLIGMCVAAIGYMRVDAWFFAVMGIGVSMLTLATGVIVEFNEIVLDEADLGILGHHPLPLRTFAAVRLTNLLLYVVVMSLALNIVPAIVGAWLPDADWRFIPSYLAASMIGNIGVASAIIVLYTLLLQTGPATATRETLAWTQIVLILLLFYGGQLIHKGGTGFEMLAYDPPAWLRQSPMGWLATFIDSFRMAPRPNWAILMLASGVVSVLCALTVLSLSRAYARVQPGGSARPARVRPLPAPGVLLHRFARAVVRPGAETASYWLCSTMLRRDADLRMRSWPAVAIVLAALGLGIGTGQFRDPLSADAPATQSTFALACLYLLAAPVPSIINNLRFSSEYRSSWVLWTAPIPDALGLAEGARKAVTWNILFPVYLLVVGAFAVMWRAPLSVALHAAIGWAVIVAAGHASVLGLWFTHPLSRPMSRGQTSGPVMLWVGSVTGAAMLAAVIHGLLIRGLAGLSFQLAAVWAVALVLKFVARRTLARRQLLVVGNDE